MGTIAHEALLRLLGERPPGGAFFLFGEETYLRDAAATRVVEAHLDPATRDFNFDQLRGDVVTADALAPILATPPMMAEWRVVVLRDAQGLSAKAREVLEAAAAAPPPGLALVVTATIPAGSKAKFYAVLQSAARSVEYAPVSELDAPEWVIERARSAHGVEVAPEAARALVGAVGSQLRMLSAELEKLVAYAGERRAIAFEDVAAVVGAVPRYDRWAWFDLIGQRRFDEALQQLPVLLASGESGVGLVIGISAQLVRIGLVCAGGGAALERELKPFQRWLVRRIEPQARGWSVTLVDSALAELLRTDRLLKSASLTDRQALEELLLRLRWLCEPPRTGPSTVAGKALSRA